MQFIGDWLSGCRLEPGPKDAKWPAQPSIQETKLRFVSSEPGSLGADGACAESGCESENHGKRATKHILHAFWLRPHINQTDGCSS